MPQPFECGVRLKGGDAFPLKELPVISIIPERFIDPRDNRLYQGYRLNLDQLTDEMWLAILEDMRGRFSDSPPTLEEFKASIREQGGLPIRVERVEVAWDRQPGAYL